MLVWREKNNEAFRVNNVQDSVFTVNPFKPDQITARAQSFNFLFLTFLIRVNAFSPLEMSILLLT